MVKLYTRLAAALLISGTLVLTANAQILYWDSDGTATGSSNVGGDWDASNFWSTDSAGTTTPGAWTDGNTAVFSAGTDATGAFTVTLGSTRQVNGISFEEGTVTIGAGGTLNLTGAGIDTASTRIQQIDSQVSGSVGLTKTGTGTLILNGANNYTGTTTINGGVLQATQGTGLPTEFISLNGGVFQSNGSFTRSLAGSGTSNMQWTASGGGFSAKDGAFNVNIGGASAELVWDTTVGSQLVGPLLFGSSTANNLTTFVNGIDMNNTGTAAGRTITATAGPGGDAVIISGVLRNSNAAASLTKTGTGTVVLTAANTYTGGSTISGGVLQFANTSAMPATGTVNVNSGGTLGVNAGGGSEWTNSTNPSDPASIAGLIQNGTGGQGTPNQVVWASGSSLGIDTSTGGGISYSGQIGQFYTGGTPTDAVGLNKLGTGTLLIDNTSNSATGTHTVTAGTLYLNNSEVIADAAPVSVSAAGTFDMGGFNETIGSLAGAGAVGLSGALTVGNTSNTTYSGIASGSGTLTKVGTGTLTLSGANTYTGATTVSAGILSVTSATGLGPANSSTTTVSSGATLQVSGGITINEKINLDGTGSTGSNGAIRKTANNTTVLQGQLTGAGSIIATTGTLRFTQSSGGGTNTGFTGPITATGGATIRFEFISPNQLGQNNVITLDNGTLRNDNSAVPGNGSMFSSTQTMVLGAGGGTLMYDTAGGLSIVNATSVISGAGGLTKTGQGNIGVAAACTYAGPTRVAAGFLKVRTSNERFPNATALTIDAGATFDLDSLTETVGSLEGAGTLEINGGQFNVGGNNGSTTFSGQMNGTNGKVTKQGAGVFTVTGDNIQTGLTTVSAGTLLVNNTTGSGTGTGPVTVAAAGTLGGTGTIAGAITNNGTLSPGAGGVGALTTGSSFANGAGSIWNIDLSGATSDLLAVTGNINLTAADTLNVLGTGSGTSWIIGTYTGSLTGVFDTITSGYTVSYTGGNITLNTAACAPGDANCDGSFNAQDYVLIRKANSDITTGAGLTQYTAWRAAFTGTPGSGSGGGLSGAAVPEPTSLGLVAMGLVALAFCRRFER